MTKPIARDPMYRKRVFDADIIEVCVRWYVTYRLSYRDLVEMMAERGVEVAHTTVLRWVIRYVPEFEKRWRRFSKLSAPCGGSTRRTVRLDVVDPRRIGDATLEHDWNALSYEDALLLLREEVSRSGGDLSDTDKVTKSAGNGA